MNGPIIFMVVGMKCKKQRTILDLFSFWSCANCREIKEDEIIIIGKRIIGIYYLRESCRYLTTNDEIFFAFSSKLGQLLQEAMLVHRKIVLLIMEDFILEEMGSIFEAFLEIGLDIQIIIV